jgi:hypothetical protein
VQNVPAPACADPLLTEDPQSTSAELAFAHLLLGPLEQRGFDEGHARANLLRLAGACSHRGGS